jgi:hypothetical protein
MHACTHTYIHIHTYEIPSQNKAWLILTIFVRLRVGRGAETATGYGLDDRGSGVRVQVGTRIFSSPRCPARLWGPLSVLSNGYWGPFPWGKAAGA